MLALLLLAAIQPRIALGQYGRWGAFREGPPAHCFAIAEPAGRREAEERPFVAISTWPGRHVARQLHVRLRDAGTPAAVTIRIGALTVPLLAGAGDAWAHDPREDARIVAAMRAGGTLAVTVRRRDGRYRSDRYPLDGAATAIDAAAIGCLR